ncbi:DUF3397 domain-containing protein [Paenibacillus sp. NEAU-GSW1]|uniref:DUF3397 domain-containing protein n=1 Tax=Paenibacillus sp. NEAU-GSW1 TaxID=2682486 RepID=UPI0012E113F4|nr:DUF3397 domain-containing protein [Paenibacillus sp. NEAU-GSW1]MUT66206.1 DUF3397 family protein [Paenibacillus sp. NEAU-GSW1]
MSWIYDSFKYLYAYLAVIPVIPFFLVYLGYSAFSGDRKKAFRLAMDITTALLIGCVAVLFDNLFNSHFGLYGILLFLLIGGGLLGNAQFRKRGSVNVKRVFRAIWRLGFFTMSMLYLLLMFIAIGQSILAA